MRFRRGVVCLALLLGAAWLPSALAQTESGLDTVDMIEVRGVIDPAVSDYLQGRLEVAQSDGVQIAVVQLDTPGGLDISMREIISKILESKVPVVVWIAPRGARAASAGTFIAYAAHLVYMAEATEIGAAAPVNLGGESSEALEHKVTNDAAAFIRELATTRGRNAEWAVRAVRDASSLGATDAVDLNVANGIASSPTDLLQSLDGREIELPDEHTVVLETWDAAAGAPSVRLRFQNMNPLQQLLHAVTNPEIALLLMLLGTFGLIFEVYNPGIGLAGILGAVALLLAFYALSVLPTNWAGVLLVMLGLVFLVVDLHAAGLGIWTAGGMAALVSGSLILFSGLDPAVTLDPWAVIVAVALSAVFFISVMTAALRVRLRRPITGEEGIVGTVGEAKTDIAPEGTVLTKGTLWRARTMETGIAAGAKVKVMATEGLVLLVEPMHEGET